LLFDIDGTLVHTLGAGIRGMNAAFGHLHGRSEALDTIPIAGRTDRSIVINALRRIGVEPTDANIEALRDEYVRRLPSELAQLSGDGFGILPGVSALLDWVDARQGLVPALLTGNFEAGAAAKLRHFDLWRRFRFGAFGDAHVSRRDLVPLALARAAAAGLSVEASDVVVIGDTPLDVDCALAHGAAAVAVASGQYGAAELEAAGADLVLGSLENCDREGEWLSALFAGRT